MHLNTKQNRIIKDLATGSDSANTKGFQFIRSSAAELTAGAWKEFDSLCTCIWMNVSLSSGLRTEVKPAGGARRHPPQPVIVNVSGQISTQPLITALRGGRGVDE